MCIVHKLLYHIAHIAHIAWSWGRVEVQRLALQEPYSTYSTESMDPGESGGSAGWGPYSTYSTYSMELGWVSYCSASPNCASLGKAASRACPARVQCARAAGGLQRSVRVPSGFCLVCSLKRQAPVSRITGRCTRPSNSPPWRSPCRTRTFASRAQSP